MTVLNLVYPDLKSLPARRPPYYLAYSTTPGWKVFYGDPLRYKICSSIAATQYKTEEGRG
jgi:hypothetical protein